MDSLYPNLGDEEVAYYNNITGILRGNWYRIPKPDENPLLQQEELDEDRRKRLTASTVWGNVTYHDTIVGHSGKFSLDIGEMKKNATVQFVKATLRVGKDSGDSMFGTRLQGIHFPNTGEVVLASTTPEKSTFSLCLLSVDTRGWHSYRF